MLFEMLIIIYRHNIDQENPSSDSFLYNLLTARHSQNVFRMEPKKNYYRNNT